jgi:hypothetical protein
MRWNGMGWDGMHGAEQTGLRGHVSSRGIGTAPRVRMAEWQWARRSCVEEEVVVVYTGWVGGESIILPYLVCNPNPLPDIHLPLGLLRIMQSGSERACARVWMGGGCVETGSVSSECESEESVVCRCSLSVYVTTNATTSLPFHHTTHTHTQHTHTHTRSK